MASTLENSVYILKDSHKNSLAPYRDAVLLYCEALKSGRSFLCEASEESAKILSWLGVEFQAAGEGESGSLGLLELLADPQSLPQESLESFREKGFLGRTLFAALLRSSYGPEEEGYFPTPGELEFYFQRELVRPEVRWDDAYLEECQEFFFEELTPAELLGEALAMLPSLDSSLLERFSEELQGVAFLVGERNTLLKPLALLMNGLLLEKGGASALKALMESSETWALDQVERAWSSLPEAQRTEIRSSILGGLEEDAVQVLVACGTPLLKWRSER